MVLWLLATIGLTEIIIRGKILSFLGRFRPACYQCVGFWCGMICFLIPEPSSWKKAILFGFAGSFAAVAWTVVSQALESVSFGKDK